MLNIYLKIFIRILGLFIVLAIIYKYSEDLWLLYDTVFDAEVDVSFLNFLIEEKKRELKLIEGLTWDSIDFLERMIRSLKKMAGYDEYIFNYLLSMERSGHE
ncbi:MAG: hypothetical protein HYS16_00775 [Deltaproteobacteria bacterium]|nr:MAG: hypothetical protein HYS16_00775 [Deltaproteobacteria bacterium]